MNYRVPFVDPQRHYLRLKPEIDGAITACLAQGDLVCRRQLRDFEEHLASFVGTTYAVGLNSGYHALYFALLAAGVGPGDEVITVAHTFVATVSAIVHTGATPVLVDVGEDYNVDPGAMEAAVTSRTVALLPVHLNGRVCDMDRIQAIADRHGLAVIEDAAQSLGATFNGRGAGSFGLAGCFSFYPFKILGGFGDGGALTTNDPAVARMATLLRYNGEDRQTGEYHYHGYTALLDNVQAAVLDVKLRHLPVWIDHRRQIAARYGQQLEGTPGLRLPDFPSGRRRDVCQNYVITADSRDELRRHLSERGIETLTHWPKPLWMHPALQLRNPGLRRTDQLCREVLSLPMSAETELDEADYVAQCICEFADARQAAGQPGL
ncbi:MAG TPA: DegT/DnrJ/EryC1/StrS family aminotransferase [Vicinamibacterales bacterium]